MAKGKKKKRSARRLPLSPLDKLCYILLAVLSFVLAFGVWFLGDRISREIAYGEAGVIGYMPNGGIWMCLLLFGLVFFAPIAGFSLYWLETKQPLFGNRDYRKTFSAPPHSHLPSFHTRLVCLPHRAIQKDREADPFVLGGGGGAPFRRLPLHGWDPMRVLQGRLHSGIRYLPSGVPPLQHGGGGERAGRDREGHIPKTGQL